MKNSRDKNDKGSPHHDELLRSFQETFAQWKKITSTPGIMNDYKNLRNSLERLTKAVSPPEILSSYKDLQESLQKLTNLLNSLSENLKNKLPAKMKSAISILALHNWYFDFEMNIRLMEKAAEHFQKGNASKGDRLMEEHFESRLDHIEKTLVSNFPHRGEIIKKAFDAHRRGDYVLCIPVLLAQADGICSELAGKYLFKRENKRPQISDYVQYIATDSFMEAILSPLTLPSLPISAPQDQRPKGFNELNRHMVLHGESVDYGTKTNSLKAISLIYYVSVVLKPKVSETNND